MKVSPRNCQSRSSWPIAARALMPTLAVIRVLRRTRLPAGRPRQARSSACRSDRHRDEDGAPAERHDERAAGQRRQNRRHAEDEHDERHQPRGIDAGVQVANDRARDDHHRRRRRSPARSGRRSATRSTARARSRSSAEREDDRRRNRAAACGRPCPRPARRRSGTRRTPRRTRSALICVAAIDAPRSAAIVGSAGRYMSIANGPMADSRPRTIALRAKPVDISEISVSWRRVAAGGRRI